MSKLTFIFLISALFSASSCLTVSEQIPTPREMERYTYGLYISTNNKTKSKQNRYLKGEIISVDSAGIYILTDKRKEPLRFMEKDALKTASVSIALLVDDPQRIEKKNQLASLFQFAHGLWNIFTTPLFGVPRSSMVARAIKKGYVIKYPKDIKWEELGKFARFPQGIPSNVNHQEIKRILKD